MAVSRAGDQVLETGRKEFTGGYSSGYTRDRPRPDCFGILGENRAGPTSNHPVFHSRDIESDSRENVRFSLGIGSSGRIRTSNPPVNRRKKKR
jgi:hypothetical protein